MDHQVFSTFGVEILTKDILIVSGFAISYILKKQIMENLSTQRAKRKVESAYQQLLDSYTLLEELTIEKERTRISREIHDTLAHTLTVAIVQIEACKELVTTDTGRTREQLNKTQDIIRNGLNDVKSAIKSLRSSETCDVSFLNALNNFIADVQKNVGIKIVLESQISSSLSIPPSNAMAVFKVIQESITNSIRHGCSAMVQITITIDENFLLIQISDNGKGCDHIKAGYGLKGITERIQELQGSADFFSKPGSGFMIKLKIPFEGGTPDANQGAYCR
jgi:signal transduction histidine kinase